MSLHQWDAYELLKEIPDKSIDLIFTDPPYNLPAREIGQTCAEEHGDFAMGSGEMSPGEFTAFLKEVFTNLKANSCLLYTSDAADD